MAEDRFGPYVVYERLGAGGMATVHRATIELESDETREVALKRLLPQFADDKRFVDDLIREGKLASQLEHPNIVRILELGRIGRTYFIAMDLVRGESLMSILRRSHTIGQKPPAAIVLAIAAQMLDAIDHAHAWNIVHRDLSPSNLIVTREGHVKIIDFGVAKALAGNLMTSSGLAKGKLGYMALEVISGKQVDTRADIFSAGVVLWELVTVKKLFRGDSDLELIHAIRSQQIERPSHHNPACPPELDELIMRALARDASDRPQSMGEMVEVVEELRRTHFAAPRDVSAWLSHLYVEPAGESTHDDEMPLIELAHGSDAGTYDDIELVAGDDADPLDAMTDVGADPGPPSQARRFIEVDTEVSVSNYGSRKP